MYDVTVIGGGCAGLSAAVRLAARGARVLVLEAGPRLGGRATTFIDPTTGEAIDNGQHLLLGCYKETFALLRTIGAPETVRLQSSLEVAFVDRTGKRTKLQCPPLSSPWHLLGGLLDWDALGWRDRFAALGMVRPLRLARRQLGGAHVAASSPGETVQNWLIRNGQSERLREMLWEPLALAALNQSPREAAAPPFVAVLARMFGPDPQDAALGLPVVPLDRMYAEPARHFIEAHGGAVRTRSPGRVVVQGNTVASVEAAGATVSSSAVIAAVPWFALPRALAGDLAALRETLECAARRSCAIVTVDLWPESSVLDEPLIGLPGRAFQWVFDKERVGGSQVPRVTMVASGADAIVGRSNANLAALAARELIAAVPRARGTSRARALVVRQRRATFSLAPGQPRRPATTTPIEGLYLAGDWVDTGLPGTIESAVLSGRWAAEAVLRGRTEHHAPDTNP